MPQTECPIDHKPLSQLQFQDYLTKCKNCETKYHHRCLMGETILDFDPTKPRPLAALLTAPCVVCGRRDYTSNLDE
jgi:hypothetical protein